MSRAASPGIEPAAIALSGRLGHPRVHLRRTDSTSDRARELALAGAPHGTLVTADEQTAGRGRHGRRWLAPPRSALLMSLLLRFESPERAPALLPLAAAVAVCEAIGPQALVKWPNDVVVRGRQRSSPSAAEANAPGSPSYAGLAKLAGMLIEGRPQERWLVLGIGINVAVDLADLPEDMRSTAATLGKTAAELEPTLLALLAALERRLADTDADILAAWRSRDALLGSRVAWHQASGCAQGINDQGALRIRRDDGSIVELDSGEVTPANVLQTAVAVAGSSSD